MRSKKELLESTIAKVTDRDVLEVLIDIRDELRKLRISHTGLLTTDDLVVRNES